MNTTEVTTGLARLTQLTAGDLISGEVTVLNSSDTMHQAASKFTEYSVGLAPVVDEAGRCVGVLSARDFVTFELDRTGDCVPANAKRNNIPTEGDHLPWNAVLRFMTTAVQTAPFDASLHRLSEIMLAEHIHHLIVLDSRAKPIGVVSTLDVISALIAICDEQNAPTSEKR